MSAEAVEREYNNRALVPGHPAYFARWEKDSAFVRETLPCVLDAAYGPDPRHRFDLFPAANARGTLVFIHGGYWRSLDKRFFSWLAAPWVAEGVSVAIPNYRLAPQVCLEDIVDDTMAAMNWLFRSGPAHGIATDRVVVSGHSAGGHLAAALFSVEASRLEFDPGRIAGGVPFSGIYEFDPLLLFSYNSDLKLEPASVGRLNLAHRKRSIRAPLVVAAGAAESSEFQRQSHLLAQAWHPQASLLMLPGLDHFGIVDSFAERGQPLHAATLALFHFKKPL